MEDIQRRFREQVNEFKKVLDPPGAGGGSVRPKFDFSNVGPIQRLARSVAGTRGATRAETLYEHLQEEVAELRAQLAENEHLVVLFATTQGDVIQVGNISVRNPDLLILEGLDGANQRTRVLVQAGTAQLVAKIVTADPAEPKPTIDFQFSGKKGQD